MQCIVSMKSIVEFVLDQTTNLKIDFKTTVIIKSIWNSDIKQKVLIYFLKFHYTSVKVICSDYNAILPMFSSISKYAFKVVFVKPLQSL